MSKLDPMGQIELSIYPDEAIADTASRFQSTSNIRDPFKWFYKLCHEYCEREGLEKNWNKYHALKDMYPIPENARMLLPFAVKPQPIQAPPAPKPAVIPQQKQYQQRKEPVQAPYRPLIPRFDITPAPPRPVAALSKDINFFQEKLRLQKAGLKADAFPVPPGTYERILAGLEREYARATQPLNDVVPFPTPRTNPRPVTEEPIIIEKIHQRDNVSQEAYPCISSEEDFEFTLTSEDEE